MRFSKKRLSKKASFAEKAWVLCAKVPKGRVTTYKEIARALDSHAYRAVGQAMRHNPYAPRVPCHRVVASDGSLGGFGGKMNSRKKVMMLAGEGVKVSKGRIVDFSRRFYRLKGRKNRG